MPAQPPKRPFSPWPTFLSKKNPADGLLKDLTGTVLCATYPDGTKVYKYNLPGFTHDVQPN